MQQLNELLSSLEFVLENIRKELSAHNPETFKTLPPGKLVYKYNQCNKPGCPCMIGEKKHGPYLYLQHIENGEIRQHYVNRKEALQILPTLIQRERYTQLRDNEQFYSQLIGYLRRLKSYHSNISKQNS